LIKLDQNIAVSSPCEDLVILFASWIVLKKKTLALTLGEVMADINMVI
jgi:hypothetical protein